MTVAILAVLIAGGNGYSKAYSPSGANSAASLAADLPVGSLVRRAWLLAAYILPAIAVWMTLGLLANLLPLSAIALIVMAGYGVLYGVLEAGGITRPAPPGSSWQVPSEWVRGVWPTAVRGLGIVARPWIRHP